MNELVIQKRKVILLVLTLLSLALIIGWFKRVMGADCAHMFDLDKQVSQSLSSNNDFKESLINQSISINTADVEALTLLPGIGRVKAERIVEYRKENGKFKHASDLINVKGIGVKIFEKLKDQISLK